MFNLTVFSISNPVRLAVNDWATIDITSALSAWQWARAGASNIPDVSPLQTAQCTIWQAKPASDETSG